MRLRNFNLYLLLLVTFIGQVFISCDKEIDYSAITYKNYLRFEVNRSDAFVATTLEGTAEGEYLSGSKQIYQNAITDARAVYDDVKSAQKDIDLAYKTLIKAGDDFYDKMLPFRSGFEELINYADFTLSNATEGTLEGDVKPGSKLNFENTISNSKNTLNRSDLTQRMIDADKTILLNALYLFDSNVVGRANLFVENFSFESPAFNTTNFLEVPAWKLFAKGEAWAPKAEIYQGGTALLPIESVPDGEYVAKIGSYTNGIYQTLKERVHPNVKYTLNFKASLLQNKPDAFKKTYKVVVLSRLVVFDKTPGDYRFASIISQSSDTLGILPGGFIDLEQEIDISATSEFLEKNVAVDFLVRHSFDSSKPIWAECYVAIDDVKMYRKQK